MGFCLTDSRREGDSPVGLPRGAHVVDGEGALLAGLVAKPLQHLRHLFRVGCLQLPPPLPPHQVVHQSLQHCRRSAILVNTVSVI